MELGDILQKYRDMILDEWVERLHKEVSPAYSSVSVNSLYSTCSAAFEANYDVLVKHDFLKIDGVVEKIGNIRSREGFSLSDVQKAFELYRTVLLRILPLELNGAELIDVVERLNGCLSYTIHRFSDYFQALSEKEIRDYAQTLEMKVEERTRELAQSEAKYRTLVEEIHDGYFVNQDGKIVYANRAFCEMHGYKLKEVIGRAYTDFVAPESLEEVKRLYEKRMSKSQSKENYVYKRLHKNGTSLFTENRVARTFYQGKEAAIGICRDITERMEIEKRIRESENLAHIGQLTTSLAHEIRNPLSAAKMSIQMLLKNPSFTGKEKRRLEILSEEFSRLDRIVTEMLDFAKPIKFDFKPASVTQIIESCLEILDTKILDKDIIIKKSYQKGVKDVLIDAEKMEQAIINLLLNSIEAIKEMGWIRITVKHHKGNRGFVAVEICDNGQGIGIDDLPYVFDPFFSKKTKGTGLGLANTKKIIEAHGGSISLSPAEPKGVRINFSLPIA